MNDFSGSVGISVLVNAGAILLESSSVNTSSLLDELNGKKCSFLSYLGPFYSSITIAKYQDSK
jgi:hypothetical protein